MALYKEDIVDIDLGKSNLHRCFLPHSIGTADSAADRFGIRVFRNGEEVDLSGCSCYGYFRDPQGNNIALTANGTIDGNLAYITLPQACYNYDGQFTLAIKLVGGGVTGTMRIVDGVVDNTNTGGAVAPTETVPTYTEVLAVYDQMQEAVEDYDETVAAQNARISNLESALLFKTDAFYGQRGALGSSDGVPSSSTTRLRTGFLPRGITTISAESGFKYMLFAYEADGTYIGVWNGTAFAKSGSWKTEELSIPNRGYLYRAVFAYADDSAITADAISNLIINTSTDDEFSDNGVAADGAEVGMTLLPLHQHGSLDALTPGRKYNPATYKTSGVTFTDHGDGSWTISGTASANDNCDFFKFKPIVPGIYYVDLHGGSIPLRIFINKTPSGYTTHTFNSNGYLTVPDDAVSFDARYLVTNGETYSETVKYSMIRIADEKYYQKGTVLPTGSDNTDDIQYCLNTFGYCHLINGHYFTTGISMPDNSVIYGEGWGTVVELTGVVARNCITLGSNCTVRDIQISGSESALPMPPPSSDGNRNGIVFDGTGKNPKPSKGVVDGCWIHDFTGGAIRLQFTGYSSAGGLCISNCDLERNYCGIFIAEDSEFHKITNVSMTQNRYGCICNGANNFFSCCNFSSNINGFMMDNENGEKVNTAHGSVVGSTFMHNNNRTIIVKGMVSGFVFDGCNIDGHQYGDGTYSVPLLFKNSTNIVFSGCNFMNWFEKIEVDGQGADDDGNIIGNFVLFSGSSFRPEFTTVEVKNGAVKSQIKFNECYLWDGTPFDPTQN